MIQILCILAIVLCMSIAIVKLQEKADGFVRKRAITLIFVIYAIGNLYCTMFSREFGSGVTVDLRPFQTYFHLFEVTSEGGGKTHGMLALFMSGTLPIVSLILNILLYYPLGYLLPILFPKLKPKHVILIGCLCSIATEATQYILKMGWCETDDVIHNTLGTAIGVWVWHLQSKRLNKPKSNELPKE